MNDGVFNHNAAHIRVVSKLIISEIEKSVECDVTRAAIGILVCTQLTMNSGLELYHAIAQLSQAWVLLDLIPLNNPVEDE